MLDIRCRRCERHGRLSVQRLLAQYGADAALRDIMQTQIGQCPHRDSAQLQNRCNPYCLDLVRLFCPAGRVIPAPAASCRIIRACLHSASSWGFSSSYFERTTSPRDI